MKTTLCCLFLIFTPTIANAETIGDQLNHAKQQLSTDYDKRAGFVHARSALKSQLDSMNPAVDAYRKNKGRIVEEVNELNVEIAETNHEAEVHNSGRPCTFSPDHPDNCTAYDADTRRLEAARAAVKKKAKAIEVEKNQLDAMYQSVTSDAEAWDAAVKKNDNDSNDNEKELGMLKTKLELLQQQFDDCVRSQRKHGPEKMHEVCGELIDGNIVRPGLGADQ
jgi:septal ring factor EnvC (AmiA/AmiB activator)